MPIFIIWNNDISLTQYHKRSYLLHSPNVYCISIPISSLITLNATQWVLVSNQLFKVTLPEALNSGEGLDFIRWGIATGNAI